MRVLDLFSGIGGFSLGLESTGHYQTVGFCEIEPFGRAVLNKHWPNVYCHEDVRTLTDDVVRRECGPVDMLCGGFPCQDISVAGKGKGLEGERSGLFFELARIVESVRPNWLLIENVPALRIRGSDRVIDELEGLEYSCWAFVVGAEHVGASHRRHRVWIVGHAGGTGAGDFQRAVSGQAWQCNDAPETAAVRQGNGASLPGRVDPADRDFQSVAYSKCQHSLQRYDITMLGGRSDQAEQAGVGSGGVGLADTHGEGSQVDPCQPRDDATERTPIERSCGVDQVNPTSQGLSDGRKQPLGGQGASQPQSERPSLTNRWPSGPGQQQHPWEESRLIEFPLGGAVDGVSSRLVRFANRNALKAFGNSVVPQVVAAFGRVIHQIDSSLG